MSAKPDDAAGQISEVRAEAADALARTRELARGYRTTGIEDELANARDVLTVAGFECTTAVEGLPRDGEIRALFGRALREATTNVLRHAEGGPVHIGLGRRRAAGGGDEWLLRMVNRSSASASAVVAGAADGVGAGGVTAGGVGAGAGAVGGAGLAGLADRAERFRGRVETDMIDDGEARRFVLTVAVPSGPGGRP